MKTHYTRRIWRALLFLFFLLFQVTTSLAQSASNKGTDFWVAYTAHRDGDRSSMVLYITSDITTTGTLTLPGQNYSTDFNVTAHQVTRVPVPRLVYLTTSEVVENKGVHITTKDPVVVYSHIYAENVSGSTLVLPTATLGREYFVMSHLSRKEQIYGEHPVTQFAVVAAEDNTTLRITPTVATLKGQVPGVPFEVKLMRGQVYQVQSDADVTGSKVETISETGEYCKRVAVFSGSNYTKLGCITSDTGDNLYQQLYPVSAWGRSFATVPLKGRKGGEVYRILAAEDNTLISINKAAPVTLQQGQYYDFLTDQSNIITADKPVTVAQFARTQNCDSKLGDPEMIILNPVEQTLTEITVYASPYYHILKHYLNVVIPTAQANSFRLDGLPVTFTPMPVNPAYSFAQVEVAKGNHHLKAEVGFTAIAYGFGEIESYGYAAGANAQNLVQHMTLEKTAFCDGETVSYSGFASYSPLSWHWDFGDGQTSMDPAPKHQYAAPGTYTVTLTTVRVQGNDCDSRDVSTTELTVYAKPQVKFFSTPECLNKGIRFQGVASIAGNNSQVVNWHWDFGDGTTSTAQNPSHIYTEARAYDVKLTVTSDAGCLATFSERVLVYAEPVVNFSINGTCGTGPAIFQDTSVPAQDAITGWHWDFGDGTTSSDQHPQHTYVTTGTYPVILTLTFASGCQTAVTRPVVVNPKPVVAMGLPDVCILDEAQFVNKSTISAGSMTYLWDFGDGHTSTQINPRHRYTAEKEYTVRLTATSDKGCSETIEVKYIVSGAYPKADFTAAQFCQEQGVQFSDASSVPFGRIVRWEWDFGDGTFSKEQHPKHTYAKAAIYQVTLKAYSGIICESTVTKTITVNPMPVAAFAAGNVCESEAVAFQPTASVATGSIISYHWDFGDGKGTSIAATPRYTYAASGTYPVTLTVTTDKGCQDSRTELVTVYAKPRAAFSPIQGCISDEVNFQDESMVTTSKIISWHWSFGDGKKSTDQHPRHRYIEAKSYGVRLEVTTTDGCKDVIEKTVVIQPLPMAQAGPDQLPVCGTTSTTLAANAPAAGTGTWSILNGTGGQFSDVHNPRATFNGRMGETYKLLWIVRNSPCAEAWDEVELRFGPVPQVHAGPDLEIIEGEAITLQGSGEGTLLWAPAATLDNATLARPLASPTETTTYILMATSAEGCQRTEQVTVRVLQKLKIPNGISPNGDGINDVWLIEGIEDYPTARIELFNRWGDKVHEMQGTGTSWDGTRNGAPLPDGAYYYVIDTKKGRKAFTGAVTILR